MKIAIFSDSLPPRIDGIAVAVQHLTTGLVQLGHHVLLVGPGECAFTGGQFLRLASLKTPVDGYPLAVVRRRRVDQMLKKFQPTLVSVHTIGPTGLLGLSLARRHQVPVLFSWHTDLESYSRMYRTARLLAVNSYLSFSLDRCPELAATAAGNVTAISEMTGGTAIDQVADVAMIGEMAGGSTAISEATGAAATITRATTTTGETTISANLCGSGVISAGLRQAAARMSAVCAPSSAAADQVRRFGVRRPVFVMPTDVTPAHLGVGSEAAGRAARLVPGLGVTPYLLYVGRLSREKNLELLLQAFAQVEPGVRGASVRLVLVGPANDARTRIMLRRHLRPARPGRRQLIYGAVASGLRDRIILLGQLPRHHLGEIYRRAAAFVTPSLSETQCLSVSEAIALGTRVLVVDPRLAVDHPVGTVQVTMPETGALAAAMSDLLRTPLPASPCRTEITESLAVRWVAAAECAGTAAPDAVLRWNRDKWVGNGPGSYG